MNTIKAILFDYDDTLVKTKQIQVKVIQETGRKFYGVELSEEKILEKWGEPFQSLFEFIFDGVASFEDAARDYKSIRSPMEVYDGAVETLKTLVTKFKVGIVTASSYDLVVPDLKTLGFPVNEFFKIQTAEDTTVHKPDPKVFDPILQELKLQNILPNEVVYIGDALRDYQAATGAGLHFIGAAFLPKSEEIFTKVGTPYVNNFKELANIILKI